MRVHIGLNLIFLVPGESSGPETYARQLIPALLNEQPDLRLTAFINREAAESGDGPWRDVRSVTVPVRARRRRGWVRGEQKLLPSIARRAGVDLVHSLLNSGPAWGPFRKVVTIHDLIYLIYPAAHSRLGSLALRFLVPLGARTADRIIVPSDTTRRDVVRMLRIDESKVDLVPNGVGLGPRRDVESPELVRRRFGLGTRPIVLTLSLKRPHKNLVRLLEALALIPSDRRPVLVLAGHPTDHEHELRVRADELGIAADTRFVGWVPEPQLEGVFAGASCFVFPSLYEGFGLPVLEAMARGVPVACSNRGSLPEVADDAALLFDPEQPHAIAAAIERLLSDTAEREWLIRAGRENAARFSWAETARLTLQVYERALRTRG